MLLLRALADFQYLEPCSRVSLSQNFSFNSFTFP